jgi:hypothetical protein
MNVRDLTSGWEDEWDRLCETNDDAWFYHTTDWLEYTMEYATDSDPESKSFVLTYGKEIIGGCLLIATEHDGRRELSMGGGFGSCPVVADDTKGVNRATVEDRLYEAVDDIAAECGASRVAFSIPPLAPGNRLSPEPCNQLLKHGYLDASAMTRLIDLDRPLETLRDDIRDSYWDEIEAADEVLDVTVFDAESITDDAFDAYKTLHHKDAGEQTRPDRTFELMHEWIRDGYGFLVGARRDSDFVQFSYFILFNDNVYYGSAAKDPDRTDYSAGHYVQWKAIKWMHQHDCNFYEVGPQYYSQQVTAPSTEKERNISFFKRGFGGFDAPLFRGEKYYDSDYFAEVYHDRVEDCREYLEHS